MCPLPAQGHNLCGHPRAPKPGLCGGPCRPPSCCSFPGGGSQTTRPLGHLARLDTHVSRVSLLLRLPVLPVQPVPGCLSLPAAGGQSCLHGQALHVAHAGWEQPFRAGAWAMCIRRMRSDVCRSSSAFSPRNQSNRQVRSGAWARCGMGGEAAVSPGEEGTGRTCQAPARTGLCCRKSQPGPA